MQIYIDGCGNYFRTLEEFEKWAEKKNELEIIPRNSETYTDMHVHIKQTLTNVGILCAILGNYSEK